LCRLTSTFRSLKYLYLLRFSPSFEFVDGSFWDSFSLSFSLSFSFSFEILFSPDLVFLFNSVDCVGSFFCFLEFLEGKDLSNASCSDTFFLTVFVGLMNGCVSTVRSSYSLSVTSSIVSSSSSSSSASDSVSGIRSSFSVSSCFRFLRTTL